MPTKPATTNGSCWSSAAARSRSRIPEGAVSAGGPHEARPRCATTSRSLKARCAEPAAGRTCWSATPMASAASSSTRSARRHRGRTGSRSSRCSFPSGRTAEEVVPRDAAALAWMANLACLELHPHPVRADDLDHPDELRIDLDPVPGVEWEQVREVARVVHAALDDFGLVGWPKTSGSRGMHVYVRIERRWTFDEVRRAALALARDVERRAPGAGDQQVVEGRTPRRVPRLQPEREGPHRRERLFGAARPPMPACPRRWPGTKSTRASPATSRSRRCRRGSPAVGDRHAGIDAARRARSSGCSSCPRATSATGWATRRGRRITANRRVKPPRVAPSRRRTSEAPADRDRPRARKADALEGLERWKERHPEASAHLEPADVLVDAMRGRFQTWTRVRVNLQHVPAGLRPPQEALDPAEDLADDWATHRERNPRPTRRKGGL